MVADGKVTLVLGGARSGKSALAERLAAALAGTRGAVAYVATGATGADPELDPDAELDPEWAARIAAHRARRPPSWSTVEVPAGGDLGAALATVDGTALVDSLGTWLAGFADFRRCPGAALCERLDARRAHGRATVVVSEEVGLGVHPPTEVGMRFADALGALNQAVASVSDQVLLVVAGRTLALEEPVW